MEKRNSTLGSQGNSVTRSGASDRKQRQTLPELCAEYFARHALFAAMMPLQARLEAEHLAAFLAKRGVA